MVRIHGGARRITCAWAVCLAMMLMPVAQALADETYTRSARGFMDIAPDGSVEALEFETDLGDVGPGYESIVRRWQFKPILTTQGDPVGRTVRVSMRVDLYATRQEDGSFRMSTGWPTFVPVDDPHHAKRVSQIEHFPAPRYPVEALESGYEGSVVLLLQVAPDGSVMRVGTRSAALLNRAPRGAAMPAVRPFVREAQRAARNIRFAPSDQGLRELLIPVSFTHMDRDENAWSRIVFVPRAQESWVKEELARRRAAREVTELDGSGQPVDTRVVLATVIDDPWL